MKTVLLVIAIFMGATANANGKVQPEEVFGSFLDLILDQVEKDKNDNSINWVDDNGFDWQNGKVVLQDMGDKILLAQLEIGPAGVDSVELPRCIFGDNQRVSHLRLLVSKADVMIDTVRVTFQNNTTQLISVEDNYLKGEKTGWMPLKGAKDRCIKRLRVTGEVIKKKKGPIGHIGIGNGNIDIDIEIGGGNKPKNKAILQVLGLKY